MPGYSETFSHPSYFTPLLTIIWMLPVIALVAASLILVEPRRRGARLTLAALVWLVAETIVCVIAGLLARTHVSNALHDEPRKLYIALLFVVLGLTIFAAACLLLDRRLSRSGPGAADPSGGADPAGTVDPSGAVDPARAAEPSGAEKPLRPELWRSALSAGVLVALLPQAWVPLILHKTEGALSSGLILFAWVLLYDAVVVAVLGVTLYRLSRHEQGASRRLITSTRGAAILAAGMAVLPMVLAAVIALNTTPNGVLELLGQF